MPEVVRAPAGGARLRLVVVLGALGAFGPLSIDLYLPGLPDLGRDLRASASATQLTLTACLAGLALGQLVTGPLSDRFGRRRPLVIGVGLYAVASLACAVAPSVAVLVALRLVQGLSGSAGIVIGRAIARDLFAGEAAARFFSSLLLVTGLAPVLAPIVGGQLLAVTTWRGVFGVLACVGVLLVVASALAVPESLPAARRRPGGGLRSVGRTFRVVASDRAFVAHALCGGLVLGAMFAYIAGSPFVLQDLYGLSPQAFSVAFAVNGLGLVAASQVTGRLVGRVPLPRLLRAGVALSILGGAGLTAAVLSGALGVWAVLVPLFLVVTSVGIVMPTTTALALEEHGQVAGSASALVGLLQYLLGAVVAPLVGIAGTRTAVPMALLILVLVVSAGASLRLARAPAALLA